MVAASGWRRTLLGALAGGILALGTAVPLQAAGLPTPASSAPATPSLLPPPPPPDGALPAQAGSTSASGSGNAASASPSDIAQ